MKQDELKDAIGKVVTVNGDFDLGIDPNLRKIIGQDVVLIKQCKNGLVQVQLKKAFYALPMRNIDLKKETP